VVSSFVKSIQYISYNEVNIHYSGCTNIPNNYPYCELENSILQQSSNLYEEYQHVFGGCPAHLNHFLKADSLLLDELLGQRTSIKLHKMQYETGLEILKRAVGERLYELEQTQQYEKQQQIIINEQEDCLKEFAETFIEQVIDERNCCQGLEPIGFESGKRKEFEMEFIEEMEISTVKDPKAKAIVRETIDLIEASCKYFRSNLTFLKEKQEFLKCVEEKDQYTKQANIENNIPCEMADTDVLFYDLDKNVPINLLEKLYEDYQLFMKQQMQIQQDQLEEERMNGFSPVIQARDNNFGLGNLGNNIDFGQDFLEDEDNLDLLNLGEPVLRRTLF
jgi:hypothetical protein